ncbi:hypothetical protein KCU81_g6321, partial [Aureobasidium melanogenum]|uniref:Uncharacterized protein n=1 Tax=Aureobasidium melanogenum (strain CBS 110374) TaxID=1043003 RepID=A0A074VFR2_AURM1
MTPLADRSVNKQSRIPVGGLESRSRINNENVPPASNRSRLLVHSKSSINLTRSSSPTPTALPDGTRTASRTSTRGHLSAVTSDESLNASFARRQSLHQPSKTILRDKLNYNASGPSPRSTSKSLRQSSQISPATKTKTTEARLAEAGTSHLDRSLSKTPSTPQEREQRALSHERSTPRRENPAPNRTPSTKLRSSSKLPRTSVHNSPVIVSPILDSVSSSVDSPCVVSPVSSLKLAGRTHKVTSSADLNRHPPRSSSLQTPEPRNHDVGLGIGISAGNVLSSVDQEHKYTPAAYSFSRPRAQQTIQTTASTTSLAVPQHSVREDSQKVIAGTPSAKSTPLIVCSSPSLTSRSPVADEILTFAGRRLEKPADLATLDHGSARSSRRKDHFVETSSNGGSTSAVRNLPPRVPSPSEQSKLSPIRLIFGDKDRASEDVFEYTRVKQLSGSLLSSSFVGSTLSISEEADELIFGEGARTPSCRSQTSLTAPTEAEFDLPSPSENGFRVSWPADFGFSPTEVPDSPTVQSSPSVRPKAFSKISEESEQSITELSTKPSDRAGDHNPETVKDSDKSDCGSKKDNSTMPPSRFEGASSDGNTSSRAFATSKPHIDTARLPKTTSRNGAQNSLRARNDRVPSYMLPTPASEARKTSALHPPDVRRKTTSTPNLNTYRASETASPEPPPVPIKDRSVPPGGQTMVSETYSTARSGRSALPPTFSRSMTPIARPSTGHQLPDHGTVKSKSSAKTEASQRASIGHIRISRHSSRPIEISRDGTFPPTRPRSTSKGKSVLNNLKGFLTGKRDVSPTPGCGGRRFSVGSRKSKSVEVEVPDVPAIPTIPTMHTVPNLPELPGMPVVPPKPAPPESKEKTVLVDKNATRETPGDASSHCRTSSKHKDGAIDSKSDADMEKAKCDTVTLMEMGLTLRQEASKEADLVRKERMTSFAQVMLDTVTNAVEAERNMYAAMQAAEQAKLSYMMTQQGVQEMNKLVSTSRQLPLFKKNKQAGHNI